MVFVGPGRSPCQIGVISAVHDYVDVFVSDCGLVLVNEIALERRDSVMDG